MTRRAETYADRLPRIVPSEEEDISHLSDEMADILYPGRRPRPFRLTLLFRPLEGQANERALALARRAAVFSEAPPDGSDRHRAAFGTGEAETLRELYGLVRGRPGTELLVDGKAVPYAHELWLPLYFIYVGTGAGQRDSERGG
jgi:hypothetical protein